MIRTCAFAVVCLLAVPCLLPASGVVSDTDQETPAPQDFPPGFRIDRDDWETPVEPGQSIRIENLYGDVRARRNGVPSLDVFVVIQLQEQDPLRADVQIVETPEGLKVDVRYVPKEMSSGEEGEDAQAVEAGIGAVAADAQAAEGAGQAEVADPSLAQKEFIRRVDIVAYIPSGSPLELRTDDDLIEARRVRSDVVAESTGGDLLIITEGFVQAKTSSGSITSVLLSDDPDGRSLLETDTGDIMVQVPDDLNIRVRARTSGEINSEYPSTVSEMDSAGVHEAIVSVGEGRHEARVDSHSGNVDIRAWKRSGQGG